MTSLLSALLQPLSSASIHESAAKDKITNVTYDENVRWVASCIGQPDQPFIDLTSNQRAVLGHLVINIFYFWMKLMFQLIV